MTSFTAGAVLTSAALNTAFNTQTINAQTGTSYTVGSADAGELITVNNNSGGTVTIPLNTTWGAATGTIVGILNAGTAGSWTIGTAAGVTLNASSASLAALESGTLIKTATNTWYFQKGGGLPKATYSATTGSPTVTTVSGKTCLQFTGNGSITLTAGVLDALLVGGGGYSAISGSTYMGGGGGGGLLYKQSIYVPTAGTYTITVGAGGAGAVAYSSGGGSSYAFDLVAVGGGSGNNSGSPVGGGWGGSGAGSSGTGAGTAGKSVTGQGNDGAYVATGLGAGGGAGGAGSGTTAGAGSSNSITGSPVTYSKGGDSTTANTANTGNARGVSNGNGNSGIVILLIG